MQPSTPAEGIARRARLVTLAGLAVLALLAWLYLLSGAGMQPMAGMEGMATPPGWPLVATMWAVMMVAMMLPSAAPAVLLYGTVHRRSSAGAPPTFAFLAGYLACWTAFAMLAAALQLAIASPMTMMVEGRAPAAWFLIAAGLYQLTPLKDACLGRCRSPAQFLSRHYRPGMAGAFRLGLLHGAFCVGCCWLLMALLFVGGVMNLLWVVALTLIVAAEKLVPHGPFLGRAAGAALVAWGLIRIAAS